MNYTIVWRYVDTDIFAGDYHFKANNDSEAISKAIAFGSLPRVGTFSLFKIGKPDNSYKKEGINYV